MHDQRPEWMAMHIANDNLLGLIFPRSSAIMVSVSDMSTSLSNPGITGKWPIKRPNCQARDQARHQNKAGYYTPLSPLARKPKAEKNR
jgi:hypothetical protein